MRANHLILPVVALGLWFACGKLSKKRNDDGTSSVPTTETATDTSTATDDTGKIVVLKADAECLALERVGDEDTAQRYEDLDCAAKAQYCESDADCTYGGAGGCTGAIPVNKKLADLVGSMGAYRGRATDCAQVPAVTFEIKPACVESDCAGKAPYKKKDGTDGECQVGTKDEDGCKQDYICQSVYFGERPVDIREHAVPAEKCPATTATGSGTYCFEIPPGNTQTPASPSYQRMYPGSACQVFTNAAAK